MTAFDDGERLSWAGRAEAYAGSFAKLCAYPVPELLDAAGVTAGVRVLDVGTGVGTVAVAACERGAVVVAVDAQPDMVAAASRAARGAHVRLAVLPRLPFAEGEFDAVVGNFVLNHVGQPRAAVAELSRVTRVGGRIALTIWAVPGGAGQALLGRVMEAAGAGRPAGFPPLAEEENFGRDEGGFAALLTAAGLRDVSCRTLAWDHRATVEEWWRGPAGGVGLFGQILLAQSEQTVAEIKRHYDRLSTEFLGSDGLLVLPSRALLASGNV